MRLILVLYVLSVLPFAASAQELVADTVVTMKARVVGVLDERIEVVQGTDLDQTLQTIRVEIINGPEEGATITIENDFLELEKGDVFFLNHVTSDLDGTDYYMPVEKVRTGSLLVLLLLFIAIVVFFGGKQGERGGCRHDHYDCNNGTPCPSLDPCYRPYRLEQR